MFVIHHRKIFFIFSGILLVLSVGTMFVYGFNTSIDFNGGTLTEVKFAERPEQAEIEQNISSLNLGGFSVRPSGVSNYAIRTRELTADERRILSKALGNPVVERQNTIGPIAGTELRSKAIKAVTVVILMILLFITLLSVRFLSPFHHGNMAWPPS